MFVRVFRGIPKECRYAPRDHGGIGSLSLEKMTPKQRYKYNKSWERWDESETGKNAKAILSSGFMCGELGRIEGFRFITAE